MKKKRLAIMLLLPLAGGAIVNVAVAWGCAKLWKPDWSFPQVSGYDLVYRFALAEYRIGPMLSELDTGWPRPSMHVIWTGGWQDARAMGFTVPGVPVGNTITTIVGPLRPIWPGFAINTIFYAAIMWAMAATFAAVKRWRRRVRGLCHACAYPIGGSPVCTECGKPVTARR